MQSRCRISGIDFEVSPHEVELRRSFGFENVPDLSPVLHIRHL